MRCRLLLLLLLAGCATGESDDRPSILVVVIDTLRVDAVSAYGEVSGTTPAVDALAAEGVRYAQAFAPAGWTLPSHATLLSGLAVEQHGVGVGGSIRLLDSVDTLAEKLTEAGYATVLVSENPLLGPAFGMTQGFQQIAVAGPVTDTPRERPFDAVALLKAWADQHSRKPFFAFVNLLDAHDPYEVRDRNPFLPEGVERGRAERLQPAHLEGGIAALGICAMLPGPSDLAILRGLYLGDVAAADAKLRAVRETLRALDPNLVTVVTSDHGEHLGEHGLLGHMFSVRNVLLHVPLIVHGRTGPSVVATPVTLADVPVSILAWAGLEAAGDLAGRVLPEVPGPDAPDRPLVAVYSDAPLAPPPGMGGMPQERSNARNRRPCRERDRVFGDLLAITRFPYKRIRYEHEPAQLYDLARDPREHTDVSEEHPDVAARLDRELAEIASRLPTAGAPALDDEAARALRALGYAH